ncbi:MAG TPA: hypothetical protein PKK43_03470 [Spirochaetota bacterium]|nr:hypothetical protein [Spirochaetota bacterium]
MRFFTILRSENKKIALILLGAFFFTIYCFVFGQSGIIERARLEKEKEALTRQIHGLEKENRRLEIVYAEYASDKMKASECEKAGYISSGERLLFFTGSKKTRDQNTSGGIKNKIEIDTLRVIWISLSIVIIGGYCGIVLLKKKNEAITEQARGDE